MPMRTGYVSTVTEKIHQGRKRYTVWLLGPIPLYTWDPIKASLCERSSKIHKAITAATRETAWGEEIVTCDLVQPTEGAVA